MINAIIIDDEPAARASLALEIKLHCPGIRIIAEAGSVVEGIEVIQSNRLADLLFLDIQLTDGSGFEILQNIDFQNYKIIFTTAHSEYALRAIKFSPLDYLLKPIDAEELKAAVEKVLQSRQSDFYEQIQRLVQQMNPGMASSRVALATADGIHLYFVKNIVRCASDGNYTTVHFDDRTKLLVAKTLKDMETLFRPFHFERIHKSHLINLDHLRRYYNRFAGEVEMSDGSFLPVAQRKKTQLLDLLNNVNLSIQAE
ncbi:MAG TPA: LytTR family DNA-binding domain-containing protein [Saprospiraceae bacterium]|nr:LytTR family DNA-binding domain-containing protein [Saprospiraceae bacterium]